MVLYFWRVFAEFLFYLKSYRGADFPPSIRGPKVIEKSSLLPFLFSGLGRFLLVPAMYSIPEISTPQLSLSPSLPPILPFLPLHCPSFLPVVF